MKEFYSRAEVEAGLPVGMSAEVFTSMVKGMAKNAGIKLKGAVDLELITSLGEMRIIGRQHEDTGEIKFQPGDILELERWEVLPKDFFDRTVRWQNRMRKIIKG